MSESTASPDVVYLDQERLLALLSPATALEAVQGFFATHGREQVKVPARIHLHVPGRNTRGLYMPAATSDYVGVKIVHSMPERRPSVEAEVFLYNAATGKLLFWGDGKPLTALRTSAVSVAATLRLLPRCERMVVYGAGVQAAAHIAAFASAYPELSQVCAVTRGPESTQRLLAQLPGRLRELVSESADPTTDLGRCDCVVTATPAPQPLFAWKDIPESCHITAVGASGVDMNEIPPRAFLESEVWVDTPEALLEAGDGIAAKALGWDEAELKGDLFDLLGPGAPEPTVGGRSLFKSVGQAAQDLAIFIRVQELLQAGE